MGRFIVIVLATLAAGWILGRIFPGIAAVAFTVGGFSLTWLMLASIGFGVFAYKATD
jgi:hypothetical protein